MPFVGLCKNLKLFTVVVTVTRLFMAPRNDSMLALTTNQLAGTVPQTLSALTQLSYLHLGGNKLNSTIPEGITSLTGLTCVSPPTPSRCQCAALCAASDTAGSVTSQRGSSTTYGVRLVLSLYHWYGPGGTAVS